MDAIDHTIIVQLRADARANYGDIAAVVGLSASAVKRRIDRLLADGVIRGFTVQVDPAVEVLGPEAIVELFCRGTVAPRELRRMLSDIPEIVEAATVSGEADATVIMRARDVASLEVALETLGRAGEQAGTQVVVAGEGQDRHVVDARFVGVDGPGGSGGGGRGGRGGDEVGAHPVAQGRDPRHEVVAQHGLAAGQVLGAVEGVGLGAALGPARRRGRGTRR